MNDSDDREHVSPDDLATYAIGALPSDEAAAVAAHVGQCRQCASTAGEYSETVSMLAAALPLQEPRGDLNGRIMGALDQPQVVSLAAEREKRRPAENARWWGRPAAWVGSAAAAVTIGVLGFMTIDARDQADEAEGQVEQLQDSIAGGGTIVVMEGTGEAPGATVTLIISPDRSQATVVADGLPENDDEHIYQVWLFNNGDAQSVSTFAVGDDETLQIPLEGNVLASDTMAITLEEGDGAVEPTGPALVSGELSS